MVDVVDVVLLLAGVQLHQVADGLGHVLVGEDVLLLLRAAPLPPVGIGEHPPARLLPVLLLGLVALAERLVPRLELGLEEVVELAQLLGDLVPPDPRQVVPLGVEEEVLQEVAGRLGRGGLARAQLPVDVLQGLLLALEPVSLQGGCDGLGPVEQLHDLLRGPPQGLQQDGHVLASLAVDADAHRLLLVHVELQPSAPRRDDLGDVDDLVGRLVQLPVEVDAGGTDELGDHDTLGPVDDERPAVGHHGELAHEDGGGLDLAGLLVDELRLHVEPRRVGHVLVLAVVHGVLDVLEPEVPEDQLVGLGVVLDRADLREDPRPSARR